MYFRFYCIFYHFLCLSLLIFYHFFVHSYFVNNFWNFVIHLRFGDFRMLNIHQFLKTSLYDFLQQVWSISTNDKFLKALANVHNSAKKCLIFMIMFILGGNWDFKWGWLFQDLKTPGINTLTTFWKSAFWSLFSMLAIIYTPPPPLTNIFYLLTSVLEGGGNTFLVCEGYRTFSSI